jgi:hypothetical protein
MYIDRGLQKKLGKTGGNGAERVLAVPGSERKGREQRRAVPSTVVTLLMRRRQTALLPTLPSYVADGLKRVNSRHYLQ